MFNDQIAATMAGVPPPEKLLPAPNGGKVRIGFLLFYICSALLRTPAFALYVTITSRIMVHSIFQPQLICTEITQTASKFQAMTNLPSQVVLA